MANQTPQGAFIPTTNIWDPSEVYNAQIEDDKLRELLVRMYQNLGTMALNINYKDTAFYIPTSLVTGQLFFATQHNPYTTPPLVADKNQNNYRPSSRVVLYIPRLSAGVTSIAHNISITSKFSATRIYGAATSIASPQDTNVWLPLPYVSASSITNNIQLDVTVTDVVVTSGGFDYSTYSAMVILEYLVQ